MSRQPCCDPAVQSAALCVVACTHWAARVTHMQHPVAPVAPATCPSLAQLISATLKEKFGCVPVFFESSELKDKYYKGGWWVVQEGCRDQ